MNQQDLNQISARGISEQQIEHQLEQIKNGKTIIFVAHIV